MIFSPLNIERELNRRRSTGNADDTILLNEVNALLEKDTLHESLIEECLRSKKSPAEINAIEFNRLDSSKIFSLPEIENVCIKYRLRFLKTGYYKNNFPYDAIIKIKEIERRIGQPLNDFFLVAPASAFNLTDRNKDPLLFAHLGNDNYYLIHKWGGDLSWYRRLWSFPLRNLETLGCTVLVLAALSALLFPASFMLKREVPIEDMIIYRSFFFIWCIIAQGAALVYAFMAFHKNLSSAVWRNQYFN